MITSVRIAKAMAFISYFTIIISTLAWAEATYRGEYHGIARLEPNILTKAMEKTLNPNLGKCEATGEYKRDTKCIKRYQELYKKTTTEMRIVIGYRDNPGGWVEDKSLAEALINLLTKPCQPNIFACDFKRDSDDAEIFYRDVIDQKGNKKALRLKITHSAVSNFNENNQGKYRNEQQAQTTKATEAYFDGLKNADIIFYVGHSRVGSGPDFAPSKTTPDGHTDYEWYRKNHTSFKDTLNALKATAQKPKVLGFFSCSSHRDFYSDLKKVTPNTAFFMTKGISWWEDEPQELAAAINALVGQFCEPELSKSFDLPGIDPSSRVYPLNFFK